MNRKTKQESQTMQHQMFFQTELTFSENELCIIRYSFSTIYVVES